ncbi:MAG: hypothetical protein JO170_15520 [Verrucomicrobia bacterium]|nr:hypothetical protein [Verrucomicrobiota bacterium]
MAPRQFQKGLYVAGVDGPTETPLRLAPNRNAEIDRQAKWHEGNRLNSVAEELALVAVMRKQQVLMGTEKIMVIGAKRQFRKGTFADETQAAHCLPGQLYLNSLPIYDLHGEQERLIKERGMKPLPLYSKLSHLHSRTDVVNIALNKVDSLVEDMAGGRGLAVLLERSIYRLFERYRFEKASGWEADFERVRLAVDSYRVAAGYACEERLDDLSLKQSHVSSPQQFQSLSDQILAANGYLGVVQDSSFVPETSQITKFLWVVKDVLEDNSQLYSG